jgi:hypothetical protein
VSSLAPETERERRLRELAGRLLTHPSPYGPTTAELFLEELPLDAPAELPVPGDLKLLGSLARRRDGDLIGLEVILDGAKPVSDFLAGYERELESRGWRRFEQFHHQPGGFDAGWHMGPAAILVNESAVSALFIGARQVESGRSEVGLRYDRENAANMMNNQQGPGAQPPGWDVLPELRPPPGLKLQPLGSHGGGGSWTSEARAQTEMPVPELEAHFAKQLAAAGWRRIGGAADETVGWSNWEMPKPGNWRGFLLILSPLPGWRSLMVRAETSWGRAGGGSWTSTLGTVG